MTERDKEIEQMLLKFRPVSPPEGLRKRVLSAATFSPTPARHWRAWVFRAAVAAMLIFAVGLNIAAAEMNENLVLCNNSNYGCHCEEATGRRSNLRPWND